MSRAFIKEPDAEQLDSEVLERPQSQHPNYITQLGLRMLRSRLEALRQQKKELEAGNQGVSIKNQLNAVEAEIRYIEKRIRAAIPVDVAAQKGDQIRFGATVRLLDEDDNELEFTIVGEDEADVARHRISWVSPLARELLGKRIDDTVIWKRPAGDLELEITGFDYG